MIRKAAFDPFVENGYPESDGKPMAETDHHREQMVAAIETLKWWFAPDPWMYVSGNLLVHYQKGDKRRHLAPDVLVVKGIPTGNRPNLLLWKEGGRLDVVIEITSRTTRAEDTDKKFELYQDRLGVKEYFLFDPFEEYLNPTLQGHKRVGGKLRSITPVAGRIPSKILGLHLERDADELRFWNPDTEKWLITPRQRTLAAELARAKAEAEAAAERLARQQSDAEAERLRRENEELRRRLGPLG